MTRSLKKPSHSMYSSLIWTRLISWLWRLVDLVQFKKASKEKAVPFSFLEALRSREVTKNKKFRSNVPITLKWIQFRMPCYATPSLRPNVAIIWQDLYFLKCNESYFHVGYAAKIKSVPTHNIPNLCIFRSEDNCEFSFHG